MADSTRIQMGVRGVSVVTVSLDDTLTISGKAADAKAVGDALAAKVDAASVMESVTITVDGQESDNQGVIILSGEDIPVDESANAPTVKEAIEAVDGKAAADISYAIGVSIKDKIDEVSSAVSTVGARTASDIVYEDSTTIKGKVDALETTVGAVQAAAGNAVLVVSQSLTETEKQQARANISAAGTSEAVLINSQTLTTSQMAQARENIGAISAADAVSVNAQSLTTSQQSQARSNIAAADADTVSTMSGILSGAFRIERYDYTVSSVPANGAATITASDFGIIDIPGYSPAGIVTYSTGTQNCVPYYLDSHTTTGNVMMIKNLTGSAITDRDVFVAILWIKSALM